MLIAALFALAVGPLPKLTVQGPNLVDPAGKTVLLKGCNVGNWLVIEPWMLDLDAKSGGFTDQYDLEQILAKRFGNPERERLMDAYRSSWMTERDWRNIQSFKFNVIRLPMNYRLMEDDARPFQLRKDAWQWIDKAVNEAERHGLYTILDMHGVQGGQSVYDHTGRSGQNKLWTDSKNQERLAWLWGKLAERYRNRTAVVAYDVFNEPYGGTKDQQATLFPKLLASIRKVDPDKLVYAHGNYDDFSHYGNPADHGWRNVGFEMHYYPGLFGGGDPTLETQANHLNQLKLVAQQVQALRVPFLVGEMNVVFRAAGGGPMMRKTFDTHASYGWATTMWAYKVLGTDGFKGGSWGMVTNRGVRPVVNFATAPKAAIEKYFHQLASMPLEIYPDLREAMIAPTAPPLALPTPPEPIVSAPYHDAMPGWVVADIGGAMPGGLQRLADGVTLYGAGSDVWARADQFRMLYQKVDGDFVLTATVDDLRNTNSYAKAGLMAREGLEADAATAMITMFPSGELQAAVRSASGEEMKGGDSHRAKKPVPVRLTRVGSKLEMSYFEGGVWHVLGSAEMPGPLLVGAIALSHDNRQLTTATYRDLKLER